ncbi:MAG: adenosylmethionine--8-amino-7-oxononanoate transaminase [Thermodesulfovibrionales bacterium]|nr:adenosylmethionine--8-amino-7-oxononanoate transaminase [Thermodesulfovibrionales bacterium]
MGILDENKQLEDLDKKYLWHPFTQMKDWLKEKPVIISEGRDCFIKDICGRWYLDAVSSIWVNIHGHRKKEIDEAIKEQIDRISHSTLLGLSNVPAIRLAERLIKTVQKLGVRSRESGVINSELKTPNSKLNKVFYSDNGSTSVEVALKMAFQYWLYKGLNGKHSFLSLENAYHGDTLGAVSVGGIETFHKVFSPLLFKTYNAPSPYCYRCESGLTYPDCKTACLEKMEEILKAHSSEIAAVIIEPLVQAAGGMIVAPHGYLKGVRDLCTRYNVLMIADEVATGFGRTGKMFACEHEGVVPNILCVSKGITGGYLPLAVTITTDEIYNAFSGEFRELKTFFHGHSYTGNPLACAAALACLDIFEKEETLRNLKPKIELFEGWLKEISELSHVGDARNKGLMAGVELVKDKNTKEPYAWEEKMGWKAAYHARDNGVFLRPLGNVIVIMPPLSISIENLKQMLKVIKDAIIAVT